MELFRRLALIIWVLIAALITKGSVSASPGQIQSLSPITPRSKLPKRSENFTPSFDCEHHYIEDSLSIYRVKVSGENRGTNSVEFSSESVTWDAAYETIEVTSGMSADGDEYDVAGLRQHADLLNRQEDDSFASIDTDPTVPLKDQINYPDLPSTSDETSLTNPQSDISFSILSQQLIQGLRCIDCSLLGGISILDITCSDTSGWSLAALANNVSARIEIEAKLSPQLDTLEFNVPIHTITLETFEVGGIAVVAPEIVLEIPDGSYVELTSDGKTDLSFSVSGFNETEINRLPFNASISNPTITPVIGLRFNFLLSVSPFSDLASSIYAGVYIDLPKLSADFETRSTDCFPKNLLNIQPSAVMAVGGVVGAGFESTGFGFSDLEVNQEIAAVSFSLPNMCLEWNTGDEGVEGFMLPGFDANGSETSQTATDTAPQTGTRTAAGISTETSDTGGAPAAASAVGNTPGNTPARTSPSIPTKASGAAAATSSNSASSTVLKLSEQKKNVGNG
ncbi:hypothetical protein BKA65DRAFT_575080 [Rhexocercosporidium sp. MPI-PUGE-AT-0058]|nr:hypothetical protein BKA65DRAFT_575080 [Rhexocercosporidium sp. MPI-PUGE-AT-0058]